MPAPSTKVPADRPAHLSSGAGADGSDSAACALLQDVVDSAPFIAWLTDSEHNLFYGNAAWSEFTGTPATPSVSAQWLTDTLSQAWSSAPKNPPSPLAEILASQKPQRAESQLRRKDGELRWLLHDLRPRFAADGGFVGYVGTSSDITDQKEVEAARKETENLFRQVFHAAPIAMALLNAEGHFLQVNSQLADGLGYSHDELLKLTVVDVTGPEDQDPVRALYSGIRSGAINEYRYERRYLTRDGSYRWGELSGTVVRENDGSVRFVVAMVVDISERKKAEEELASSQAELRLIADSVPVLIAFVGADMRYRFANKAYLDWGYLDPSIMVGLRFDEFMGAEIYPTLKPYVDKALAGERASIEWAVPTADGSKRYQRSTYVPNILQSGEVSGFFILVEDLTAVKTAAEKVRVLNAELEERVVARTAQLENVNHELEAFCYSISHDLRGPLRIIASFSQILKTDHVDQLDPEAVDHLNRIETASVQLWRVVDELLTLSRLTRRELVSHRINLSTIAEGVVNELTTTDPGVPRNIAIEPELYAQGDSHLLTVVLQNLFSNAWKFARDSASPAIEFGQTESDGKPAFFVRDNGVGFDMKFADKLFSYFERLHRSDEFEGDGIGLATVNRIVKRHGGRVWAEAAPGQGATFYFTLAP